MFKQNPLAGRARGKGGSKVYRFEAESGGAKCASVPSGLGMNRVAQRFRSKSVSVDGARRNTYTQERAGVNNARERTRTSTGFYSHQHLKLARLPIPPLALKGWEL